MAKISLPNSKTWRGEAYRNIATCDPSRNLYDDLADPEDFKTLFEIEKLSQGIDQHQMTRNRCFQYGDIDRSTVCFDDFFAWGRFSDGKFGVWYGALDEQTSIKETSYKRAELDSNDFSNSNGPIIQCRRLFLANLDAEDAVDLNSQSTMRSALTSDDYSYCQKLGAQAQGIEMFLTPSARNQGGICTPVFSKSVVRGDKALRTYLVIYSELDKAPKYATVSDDI